MSLHNPLCECYCSYRCSFTSSVCGQFSKFHFPHSYLQYPSNRCDIPVKSHLCKMCNSLLLGEKKHLLVLACSYQDFWIASKRPSEYQRATFRPTVLQSNIVPHILPLLPTEPNSLPLFTNPTVSLCYKEMDKRSFFGNAFYKGTQGC